MDNIKKQNIKKKNKKDNAIKILKKIAIVISFVLNAFFIFSLLLGSCSNNSKKASADAEDYFLSANNYIYTAYRISDFSTSNMNDITHSVNLFNNIANNTTQQIFSYANYECYYNGSHIENINLCYVSKIERLKSGDLYMIKVYYFNGDTYISDLFNHFQLCISFLDNVPYVSNPDTIYGLRVWTTDWNTIYYNLPAYWSFDINEPSYIINCPFEYNNNYYKGIKYTYHTKYSFIADNGSNLDFNCILSDNHLQYVAYHNNVYDLDISSYQQYFNSIPKLYFLNLSTNSINYFNSHFIPFNNEYINGVYYLNTPLINSLLSSSSFCSSLPHSFNYSFNYTSNNQSFSGLYLSFWRTGNDNVFKQGCNLNFLYGSTSENFASYSGYIDFNISSSTIENHYLSDIPYICLNLDNIPFNVSLYSFLVCWTIPYQIKNISVGGNVNPLDGTFSIFTSLFNNISNMLNVEIYKNITLMSLCLIPLITLLILALIRLFRH